jgi:hypothetical protein
LFVTIQPKNPVTGARTDHFLEMGFHRIAAVHFVQAGRHLTGESVSGVISQRDVHKDDQFVNDAANVPKPFGALRR